MRNPLLTIASLLLAATTASAQMKPQPAAPPAAKSPITVSGARSNSPQQFPRVTVADAYKLLSSSGKVTFIDVRSNEKFTQGHIKGALSIPRSQLIARFKEVPPGTTIITYCACGAEESSGAAASNLIAHGVKNVFALKGGWDAWKAARYPIAAGPK